MQTYKIKTDFILMYWAHFRVETSSWTQMKIISRDNYQNIIFTDLYVKGPSLTFILHIQLFQKDEHRIFSEFLYSGTKLTRFKSNDIFGESYRDRFSTSRFVEMGKNKAEAFAAFFQTLHFFEVKILLQNKLF